MQVGAPAAGQIQGAARPTPGVGPGVEQALHDEVDGRGQRLEVRRVDCDDVAAEMARAVEAVGRFWTQHVDTDTPLPGLSTDV